MADMKKVKVRKKERERQTESGVEEKEGDREVKIERE